MTSHTNKLQGSQTGERWLLHYSLVSTQTKRCINFYSRQQCILTLNALSTCKYKTVQQIGNLGTGYLLKLTGWVSNHRAIANFNFHLLPVANCGQGSRSSARLPGVPPPQPLCTENPQPTILGSRKVRIFISMRQGAKRL